MLCLITGYHNKIMDEIIYSIRKPCDTLLRKPGQHPEQNLELPHDKKFPPLGTVTMASMDEQDSLFPKAIQAVSLPISAQRSL